MDADLSHLVVLRRLVESEAALTTHVHDLSLFSTSCVASYPGTLNFLHLFHLRLHLPHRPMTFRRSAIYI
jgi:hypothetical protein